MEAGFGPWLDDAPSKIQCVPPSLTGSTFYIDYISMQIVFGSGFTPLSIDMLFPDGHPARLAVEHSQQSFDGLMQRMESMVQGAVALNHQASQLLRRAEAQFSHMEDYLQALSRGTPDDTSDSELGNRSDSDSGSQDGDNDKGFELI
jgi:hypothetical protein